MFTNNSSLSYVIVASYIFCWLHRSRSDYKSYGVWSLISSLKMILIYDKNQF